MKRSPIHRGSYYRIDYLARIAEASPADVIAAAKIYGATVMPGLIFFPTIPEPEYFDELLLIKAMNLAAARRRPA